MNDAPSLIRGTVYEVRRIYVALFYALLALWTGAAVPLAVSNASRVHLGLLLMIVFFVVYTWYWSLGISYRIRQECSKPVSLGKEGSSGDGIRNSE